jgi:hypothetical protein
MQTRSDQDRRTSKTKGLLAASTAAGGVILAVATHPVIGLIGLGGAAYLAYDWFKFRAKRGMRF